MLGQPTGDKAFLKIACSLAIALLTIGMGINPSWAWLDQPSGLKSTPLSTNICSLPNASHGRLRWLTEMSPLPAAASGIIRLHSPVMLKRKFAWKRGVFAPANYPAAPELRFASLCLAAGPPRRAIIAFLQDTPVPPTNGGVAAAHVVLMEGVNDYVPWFSAEFDFIQMRVYPLYSHT
jgi:hypothetical protein